MTKKVLIFGASGWLGRITLNFIKKNGLEFDTTLVASTRKTINNDNYNFTFISTDDFRNIKNQSFDYYLNFAFLTQDKLKVINELEYSEKIDEIIKINSDFFKKNKIQNSLLISSGAVYWKNTPKENLYTLKKLEQEDSFIQNNKNYIIGRLFGVLGSQYDLISPYAFTSFIKSAKKEKKIKIDSKIKVLRSYLYFENFLDLFFKDIFYNQILDIWDKVFDIYELAKIISEIFDAELVVDSNYFNSEKVDIYLSSNYNYQTKYGKDISYDEIRKSIFEKNIFY